MIAILTYFLLLKALHGLVKKALQLQWLQMHCRYTRTQTHTDTTVMEICNWTVNKCDNVTELSVVSLYSNDNSDIAGDVNTIYLCKRTMRALCQRATFYWLIKFYPAYSSANWSQCLYFKKWSSQKGLSSGKWNKTPNTMSTGSKSWFIWKDWAGVLGK